MRNLLHALPFVALVAAGLAFAVNGSMVGAGVFAALAILDWRRA